MPHQYLQHGEGNCSLCGSLGTNKSTCPWNPDVSTPNHAKHPLAVGIKLRTGAPAKAVAPPRVLAATALAPPKIAVPPKVLAAAAPKVPNIIEMCYRARRDPTLLPLYLSQLTGEPREVKYNLAVLATVASISGYRDPIMMGKTDLNGTIFQGTPKMSYFMEDAYTEDIALFMSEYHILERSQKSKFFYQSNIANIALVLMCLSRGCYDDYYVQFHKSGLGHELMNPVDLRLHFDRHRDRLLDALLKAYETFFYPDVVGLYRAYLEFCADAIHSYVPHLRIAGTQYTNTSYVMSHIKVTENYYLYLSCNLVAEYKCARFIATKFIFSYIGSGSVHAGMIVSPLTAILHDMIAHGSLDYVPKGTDRVRQDIERLLLKTYHVDADLCKAVYELLFEMQHEAAIRVPLTLDLIRDTLVKVHAGENLESSVFGPHRLVIARKTSKIYDFLMPIVDTLFY